MYDLVIIGGGPSGLAAAYEAVQLGGRVLVLEKQERVGGLARTIPFKDCLFDIGPHRFFTKNQEVHDLYVKVLAEDLVHVPRQTRIFYKNRYFDYPLSPVNALLGLGPIDGSAIILSYLATRAKHKLNPVPFESFEDWVVANFGRRLFECFFKTYTEKVWGIPCTEISADWAAQRIKGLNLTEAILNALGKKRSVKSLIDEFVYPRLGAGHFYEKLQTEITRRGSEVLLNRTVTGMQLEGNTVKSIQVKDGEGRVTTIEGRHFLASCPITHLLSMLEGHATPEVREAAGKLRYRHHIGVNLIVTGKTFPDNWLYIHAKEVKMARVSNYLNFSKAMSPSPDIQPLTIEYFTFEHEPHWQMTDAQLIECATSELLQTKILKDRAQVRDAFAVRSPQAYPVLDKQAAGRVEVLRQYLSGFSNLLPIGRSGMFKYNNQDHAIATGLLATRRLLGGKSFDPWLVNIDAEYHEIKRL